MKWFLCWVVLLVSVGCLTVNTGPTPAAPTTVPAPTNTPTPTLTRAPTPTVTPTPTRVPAPTATPAVTVTMFSLSLADYPGIYPALNAGTIPQAVLDEFAANNIHMPDDAELVEVFPGFGWTIENTPYKEVRLNAGAGVVAVEIWGPVPPALAPTATPAPTPAVIPTATPEPTPVAVTTTAARPTATPTPISDQDDVVRLWCASVGLDLHITERVKYRMALRDVDPDRLRSRWAKAVVEELREAEQYNPALRGSFTDRAEMYCERWKLE